MAEEIDVEKCNDSVFKRKLKNRTRTPTSYRLGPVLHGEMAEEIDLEKCNFRQLSELQKPRDLNVDLGSDQVIIACTIRVGLPACQTM